MPAFILPFTVGNKLGRKLTSLTLSILLASGITFSMPGTVPVIEAASTVKLIVSAENSQYFAGPQVIEVVVLDSDISETRIAQGEPDVTVNAKKLRMAQATDGIWYGYFASKAQAQLADHIALMGSPGRGLDFGVFCSNTTGNGTLGVSFFETVGVAIPGNNGITNSTNGNATFSACTGSPSAPNPIQNHVVRKPQVLNPGDGGVLVGQIGIDPDSWPIIQLYDFPAGSNVVVKYNKGGVPQTTTLTFDTIPSNLINIALNSTNYQLGAQVNVTLTDPQLNIDPTDKDSWTWAQQPGNTGFFYQAFYENGTNDANSGSGLVDLSGNLTSLMFERNGRVEVNLAVNGSAVTEFDTNSNQTVSTLSDGSKSYPQIISFVESAEHPGIFVNYDKFGDSNLDILAKAENGKSATIKYNNIIKKIQVNIPPETKSTILFKSGAFTPDHVLNTDAIKTRSKNGFVHFLLQFTELPSSEQQKTFALMGIKLLNYVTGNTYIAYASVGDLQNLESIGTAQWAGPFNVDYKIAHDLKIGKIPNLALTKDKVVLDIYFHKNVNPKDAKELVNKLGGQYFATVQAIPSITAAFDLKQVNTIAQDDWVQYVNVIMPPLEPANDVARQVANVTPLDEPPYNLRGSGVSILIYDGGLVGGHEDFNGRIEQIDDRFEPGTEPDSHSTLVAGIVGGDGHLSNQNSNGGTAFQWAGMAPAVKIHSYGTVGLDTGNFYQRIEDLNRDVGIAIGNHIDLATMSMTQEVLDHQDIALCPNLGDYYQAAILIDEIVTGHVDTFNEVQHLIFFEAAGNERNLESICRTEYPDGYRTISSPATAKNSIAIGAITSDFSMSPVSSWGPTDDGRIKPDIVSPGCSDDTHSPKSTGIHNDYLRMDCATSYATPIAAGAAALLIEEWKNDHQDITPLLPHTAKAILIHTATDISPPGPDYMSGWGALNATAAIVLVNTSARGAGPLIIVGSVTNGVEVPSTFTSNGANNVKATLVWDDPPGSPPPEPALVNDLDLELVPPPQAATGITFLPFNLDPNHPEQPAAPHHVTGTDTKNNVEMVISDFARAGTWTVNVKGTRVTNAPQSYTLIISDTFPEYVSTSSGGGSTSIVPDPPSSLTASSVSPTQIDLSWTAPSTSSGSAITYMIERMKMGESTFTQLASTSSITFSDTTVTASTTYTYRVFATNSAGTSTSSNQDSATTPTLPPTPDFSISTSPSSLNIVSGSSDTSTITINSLNGFSGSLNLDASPAITGITTAFNPSSVTVSSGGTASSTLTISVGSTTTAGPYSLTVTGTDGSIMHSTTINLEVITSLTSTSDPCNDIDNNGNGIVDEGVVGVDDDGDGSIDEARDACRCLIATAAFGSELAPQVQQLRELRDNTLLKTTSGSTFMAGFNSVYYSFSPTIADWERQNPIFKEVVKITITPLLSTLSILNYVDIDSEAKMLVYGISIILLNIGMYFVAPAFVMMRLRRK